MGSILWAGDLAFAVADKLGGNQNRAGDEYNRDDGGVEDSL